MVFECFSLAHPIQEPASQLQLQPSQARPMRAQPPLQPAKPSQLGSYCTKPSQARDMFSAPAAQTKVWANMFYRYVIPLCLLIRLSHYTKGLLH